MKSSREIIPSELVETELETLHQEVDTVRNVMTYNIQQTLENSDNIEDLSIRTHQLANSAKQFRRHAKNTRKQHCCSNFKYYCWGCSGLATVIYLIGAWSCQSLTWNC